MQQTRSFHQPRKPLVTNASDPRQVEAAQTKASDKDEQDALDFEFILSTPAGRRFVWRYLEFTGVFRSSFTTSGSETFYKEGMRNVGLKLMNDINKINPEAYILMTKEQQ